MFLQPLQVHPGQIHRRNFPSLDQGRESGDRFERQIFDGGEALGFPDGGGKLCWLGGGFGWIEPHSRFGIERHIDLAESFIASEGSIQPRQHHGFLFFGKIETNELQSAVQHFFGYTARRSSRVLRGGVAG